MRPYLLYTAARVGLFVVVAAILYVVGFGGLLLAGLALVISLVLSAVVLKRLRHEVASDMTRRMDQRREKQQQLRGALGEDQDES